VVGVARRPENQIQSSRGFARRDRKIAVEAIVSVRARDLGSKIRDLFCTPFEFEPQRAGAAQQARRN
jgi:hypothetical protein